MSSLAFSNYVILGGHILNISKAIFTKLIFHLRLSKNYLMFLGNNFIYIQRMQYIFAFRITSKCVNIKNSWQFLLRHACVAKFTFIKLGILKKKSVLLKLNLLFMFKCKQFFLPLAYFCSEVIILIFFLVNFMGASFLIDLFN